MVYLALYNNKLIDAIEVLGKTSRKYICPDPDCNDNLIYRKHHERNINRINENNESVNILSLVTAHFTHYNKNKDSTCNSHCFISSIGNPDAIEFYRKWCCPFINESIYNCFNSKSKFHIMYEDIQIITSIKTNNKDFIQKKESFIHNNEKLIWILKINGSSRNTLNNIIIRRIYYENNEIVITKYYLISDNDEYYDFELYDINKSIIYLDFGYNQLVKLIKNSNYQGYEVELISISEFINKFSKIKKSEYNIQLSKDIDIKNYDIHIDILTKTETNYNNMINYFNVYKNSFKSKVNHRTDKIFHKEYLKLQEEYNIENVEIIQQKIYYKKSYENNSYDCNKFIWNDNDDNFDNYINSIIKCNDCINNILNSNNIKCDNCIKYNAIKLHSDNIYFLYKKRDESYWLYNDHINLFKLYNDDFDNYLKLNIKCDVCINNIINNGLIPNIDNIRKSCKCENCKFIIDIVNNPRIILDPKYNNFNIEYYVNLFKLSNYHDQYFYNILKMMYDIRCNCIINNKFKINIINPYKCVNCKYNKLYEESKTCNIINKYNLSYDEYKNIWDNNNDDEFDNYLKLNIKCNDCINNFKNNNCKFNIKCVNCKMYDESCKYNKIMEKQEHKKLLKLDGEACKCDILLKNICKCDILLKNICMCKSPIYELIKISNNMFCINCNKWKCRCK